jgi:hypothetical protein
MRKGHETMDEMSETPETGENSVTPPSQETDYSQGYEVKICFYPNGFTVTGPSPLPQLEDDEEDERISDLATALKHVVAIAKEHPLDGDMQSHFQAGYEGD